MADIAFTYENERGYSDIQIKDGDFLLCDTRAIDGTIVSSLQVAVEISLFTDRRATADEINGFKRGQPARTSRRGYWANFFRDNVQGSGLWLLDREKRRAETIARAQTYATDALNWMVLEGVAQTVAASASFSGTILILDVTIRKPDGQDVGFKYNFAWDSLEVT